MRRAAAGSIPVRLRVESAPGTAGCASVGPRLWTRAARAPRTELCSPALAVRAGRILKVVGSDEQRSHGGRLVPDHAETVASSVLHQDIAGRKQHLRAIVKLDC